MNYYQPREIRGMDGNPSGRWHYTCMNDGRIWPVGYCAQGCPGHDSKDGAYEHQRQYVLDHKLRLDGQALNTAQKCLVCGAWTDRFAEADMQQFFLCDAHRTREEVASRFEVGDAISSW